MSTPYSGKTRSDLEELQSIMAFLELDPETQRQHPKDQPHTWYEVKEHYRTRKEHPIKNKTALSKHLRMSRPTLNNNINIAHKLSFKKEAPKSTEPSWYKRFYQTRTFKVLLSQYYDKEFRAKEQKLRLDSRARGFMNNIRLAWRLKGEKEPIEFSLKDFMDFWGDDKTIPIADFQDPETGAVEYGKAVALRWCMRESMYPDISQLISKEDPRFSPVKRKKGKRKFWYFNPEEIPMMINVITDPQTLVISYVGVVCGARGNTILKLAKGDLHPHEINEDCGIIHFFESKTKDTTGGDSDKPVFQFFIDFLLRYCKDFNRNNRVFTFDLQNLNDHLSAYAEQAGIRKYSNDETKAKISVTSHIFKHTCATLMLKHRIELDAVSAYTHTDATTLLNFYSGATQGKVNEQVLDLPRSGKTWKQLITELHPQFVQRYEYLLSLMPKTVEGSK